MVRSRNSRTKWDDRHGESPLAETHALCATLHTPLDSGSQTCAVQCNGDRTRRALNRLRRFNACSIHSRTTYSGPCGECLSERKNGAIAGKALRTVLLPAKLESHDYETTTGSSSSDRALAERRGWSFPIIRCEAGFLDPSALTLSVQGVPRSFLLGADSTLLARDLSPGRLAELLPRGR